MLALLAAAFAGFTGLGTWQVERRAWKLDLIQRVEARIHAAPSSAPGSAEWPHLRAADDEYRHVRVTGRFQSAATIQVKAVTELGPGFWLMTPLLRVEDGSTVLVNRGFVGDASVVRAAMSLSAGSSLGSSAGSSVGPSAGSSVGSSSAGWSVGSSSAGSSPVGSSAGPAVLSPAGASTTTTTATAATTTATATAAGSVTVTGCCA